MKPRNLAENRVPSLRYNRSDKNAVVIVRERNGNSVPAVFRAEGAAMFFIKVPFAKGKIVNAAASPNWDDFTPHSR